jgi:hypothetical protein
MGVKASSAQRTDALGAWGTNPIADVQRLVREYDAKRHAEWLETVSRTVKMIGTWAALAVGFIVVFDLVKWVLILIKVEGLTSSWWPVIVHSCVYYFVVVLGLLIALQWLRRDHGITASLRSGLELAGTRLRLYEQQLSAAKDRFGNFGAKAQVVAMPIRQLVVALQSTTPETNVEKWLDAHQSSWDRYVPSLKRLVDYFLPPELAGLVDTHSDIRSSMEDPFESKGQHILRRVQEFVEKASSSAKARKRDISPRGTALISADSDWQKTDGVSEESSGKNRPLHTASVARLVTSSLLSDLVAGESPACAFEHALRTALATRRSNAKTKKATKKPGFPDTVLHEVLKVASSTSAAQDGNSSSASRLHLIAKALWETTLEAANMSERAGGYEHYIAAAAATWRTVQAYSSAAAGVSENEGLELLGAAAAKRVGGVHAETLSKLWELATNEGSFSTIKLTLRDVLAQNTTPAPKSNGSTKAEPFGIEQRLIRRTTSFEPDEKMHMLQELAAVPADKAERRPARHI